MPYYDNDNIDRAVKFYFRQAQRAGSTIVQQPDRNLSDQTGDVISIRNAHGELARYRVLPSARLRTL